MSGKFWSNTRSHDFFRFPYHDFQLSDLFQAEAISSGDKSTLFYQLEHASICCLCCPYYYIGRFTYPAAELQPWDLYWKLPCRILQPYKVKNKLLTKSDDFRPLNDLIVLEFRDHILRYARRFFHHLLRHRRLQKSFLLAIDIGAQDLFLDVHHMALHYKEFGLAAEAARKVDECIESDEYDDQSAPESDDGDQSGTIQRFMKHVHGKKSHF